MIKSSALEDRDVGQKRIPKRAIRSMDRSVKPPELPTNRQQMMFTPNAGDFGYQQFDRHHAASPSHIQRSRPEAMGAPMMAWYLAMEKWTIKTKVIRELKHRAPASSHGLRGGSAAARDQAHVGPSTSGTSGINSSARAGAT